MEEQDSSAKTQNEVEGEKKSKPLQSTYLVRVTTFTACCLARDRPSQTKPKSHTPLESRKVYKIIMFANRI